MMKDSLKELANQIDNYCVSDGEQTILLAQKAATHQLLWLDFLRQGESTNHADCLLDGALSAIRESAVCIAIGLVRPAMGAMRLQIDLALSWLYFRDHVREWERVQRIGEGFKLKTEALKYLSEHIDGFSHRIGILKAVKTRAMEDPYRILSAHIHGQAISTLPVVDTPLSILCSPPARTEAVEMLAATSEFISDIFWSVFADDKFAIPPGLEAGLTARFVTPAQQASFYAGQNIEAKDG